MSSTAGGVSLNPEVKTKKEKNLKRKQDKPSKLEQRKKKRSAKAEKRALKSALAGPKEVVVDKPRKSKAKVKRTVTDEKRKEKLKVRAEKLQEKANLLMAEAKKAAAQYQAFLDAEKTANESKSEQNDDDTSSDSDTSDDDDDSSSENEGGAPVAKEPTDVPMDIPADEIVMKHRRLSNAASERSYVSAADIPVETEQEPKKSKKDKKDKKAKKVRVVEPEEVEEQAVESEAEVEEPEASDKKSKKAEKKRKRAAETKGKKEQGSDDAAAQAEQWHVDALEGGTDRQAKFLRLLGGKKAGAPVAATQGKGTSDSTKAEADIQKQFEAGMKMKNEAGSKRRGLGA
ncbi:hypothetical protein ACHAQI_005256 [Fusarium lateritium]